MERAETIATFMAAAEKLKREADKQKNALQAAKKRDVELNRIIPELRNKLTAKAPQSKKPRPAPQPATPAEPEEAVIDYPAPRARQFTFRL